MLTDATFLLFGKDGCETKVSYVISRWPGNAPTEIELLDQWRLRDTRVQSDSSQTMSLNSARIISMVKFSYPTTGFQSHISAFWYLRVFEAPLHIMARNIGLKMVCSESGCVTEIFYPWYATLFIPSSLVWMTKGWKHLMLF